MHVGIPTEIKADEKRVAITPAGVAAFAAHGHDVLVQAGAGVGSYLPDEAYEEAGAKIVPDARTVWEQAELVLKVKEPLDEEYDLLRPDQVIFTYLHLAASEIGAVLFAGARAPVLVSRDLLGRMEPGSAIVDISVDQGGSVETTRPTTHGDPRCVEESIVDYGVANMPGAVPQTSTYALTNATLGYALELADQGWRKAVAGNRALARGVNCAAGELAHAAVAEAFDLPQTPLEHVLGA